jgi:hypothetical protein
MKQFILITICCVILFSCKKENTSLAPIENSNQSLTKIIKTTDFGGGTYTVEYQFNITGKIIKEGNTVYERDKQQRIINIQDLGSVVNGIFSKGSDVVVHYSDAYTDEVAYTICNQQEINATDSAVYLHEDGRLAKIMLYYVSNLKTKNIPDTTFLLGYWMFKYDEPGNLQQMDKYAIDYTGKLIHCSQSVFDHYDNKVNPLYSADEVRIWESACHGMLNNSKNNFTSGNGYAKTYEFRADRRPRTCLTQQNGRNVSKLIFEYN